MNAREVALAVVRDVFPADERQMARGAQEALDYRLRRHVLEGRDRAFATELAYGAIKMRRALDWYLEPFIGERREPLPAAIHEILRLAVYELTYTQADEHATVYEFVNLAKKYGHPGVAGLANAVLRSFLRDRPKLTRDRFESDDEFAATMYSLPTWLVRQWRTIFGSDRLDEIARGVNAAPQTAITVDTQRSSVEAVAVRLQERGISSRRSEFVAESLLVDAGSPGDDSRGAWFVQSESAAMPVAVLNPQPGERIADACSGRGNKALQIAVRVHGESELVCIDADVRKTAVLQARFEQAGLTAAIVVGDAVAGDILPQGERFDRVLVDAPCSGTGVVGRHPEARWRKRSDDGERLSAIQRELLEAWAPRLHEGGALVYAACSTDPRETVQVVNAVLRTHGLMRGLIPSAFERFLTPEGDVLVPPGISGRDGFYIARLER